MDLEGTPVEVYWNSHFDCFSIRTQREKRVVAHASHVVILDADFSVSVAGNQRVNREQKKNVHALIRGTFAYDAELGGADVVSVAYNPYKMTQFTAYDTSGSELGSVYHSPLVVCSVADAHPVITATAPTIARKETA